jgi:RND family efflux transporter MFP subunit
MSGSMYIGRVLLPCIGLVLAASLGWQTWRSGTVELRLPSALDSWTGAAGVDQHPSSLPAISNSSRASEAAPVILAEGHVAAYPGAEVVVGAELAGTITRVLVQEKSIVHKGDLLLEFRGDEIRASAEEAVARVNEADAELTLIEQDQARANRLAEKQPGQAEVKDRLKARWSAARARRAAAVAGYRRIQAEFDHTRVRSPIDGVVVSRTVSPGETVSLGTPLLRIVDLKRLRIEAEIDEYDIPRCAPGCAATITTPGRTGLAWQGTVEEVADSLVPRHIRPEDPGRPTDTRVLPVRIAFQQPTPLKLGQRVEVRIAECPSSSESGPRTEITSTKTTSPRYK